MSRPQERPSGLPSEGGLPRQDQGMQGTGMASGAGATSVGPASAGTATTTSTRAGVPEQATTSAEYQRGTAPAGYERGTYAAREEGGATLGGVMLIAAGLLTFFAGLSAVVRTSYYHAVSIYAYAWTIHSWGIALLVLGAVMFAIGACAMLGMTWAKWAGVGLAVLAMIGAFMFLVYTPVWGVILLAVSAAAIWGLLRPETV